MFQLFGQILIMPLGFPHPGQHLVEPPELEFFQGFPGQVIEASNSPLAEKYPGFTVDYSTVNGSGRIDICTVSPDTGDHSSLFVSVLLLLCSGSMLIALQKKNMQ